MLCVDIIDIHVCVCIYIDMHVYMCINKSQLKTRDKHTYDIYNIQIHIDLYVYLETSAHASGRGEKFHNYSSGKLPK